MKKELLLILMAIMLFNAIALCQSPNYKWAVSETGAGNDYAKSITTDASGNVFVAGYFEGTSLNFGISTLFNNSTSSCYLAKYDTHGNCIWVKGAQGTSNSLTYSVKTDSAANVYISGIFYGGSITFESITLTNSGGSDIFLVKYDSTGNLIWAKGIGGISNEYANSLAIDSYGNVTVAGRYQSASIVIGSTTISNAGVSDIFIAKFGSAGNFIKVISVGGTNYEEATSICTDTFGNIFVTGFFYSSSIAFGSTTLYSNTTYAEVFIAKYDTIGNVLWAKQAVGSKEDRPSSIAADHLGNIYVTGIFESTSISFGSTTLTNAGGTGSPSDAFLTKYNANGNLIWAKRVGGTSIDISNSIAVDSYGNAIIAGCFRSSSLSFGSTTLYNSYLTDIYVAKYNATGDVLWAKWSGDVGNETIEAITTDIQGNLYLAGEFTSSIGFDSFLLTNTGTNDILLAKLSSIYFTATSSDVSCNGGADGSIVISANGGIGALEYSIDSGAAYQTSPTFSYLTANTYNILVKDSLGAQTNILSVVISQPLSPSITEAGTTLTSSSSTGNQWYLNGNIINGATTQSYTVTQNGNYSVVVTVNGCSATSDQVNFTSVGNVDFSKNNSLIILPNPNHGIFQLNNKSNAITIKIFNTLGEIVYENNVNENTEIDFSGHLNGVYFIEIADNNNASQHIKVVKN